MKLKKSLSSSTEVDVLAAIAVTEASVLAQLLRACSNSLVQLTRRGSLLNPGQTFAKHHTVHNWQTNT